MLMNKRIFSIVLFSAALLFRSGTINGAVAAESDTSAGTPLGASEWIKTEQTSVRLISATSDTGGASSIKLGLHFKLKKGWKIYWRTPGDAGFPPRLRWIDSANLGEIEFSWPAPERFTVLDLQTMGYKKEVVFPINAEIKDPSKPVRLRAELDYLTCDDICIPYRTKLSLDLPKNGVNGGTGSATDFFHLINRYIAKVPGNGNAHSLKIETIETLGPFKTVEKDIRKGFVRVAVSSGVPFTKPDLFIEGPELAFFSLPRIEVIEGGKKALMTVPVTVEEDTRIDQASLRLTVTDGDRSVEENLTVKEGAAVAPPSALQSHPPSLPVILGLALIGGLILNLMPCVLPVLSLKVLGVISYGSASNATVRMSFIASSLGILFSFLAIAAGLTGIKLAGSAVGWGIQFQHPWFIVGLAVIVTLFAYNLWGMFEINLPYWMGGFGTGGSEGDHHSFGGNFATGAFATVLATPCSAPFLGTAIGFALSGQTSDIFAVFAALGLGMAMPFILIAAFPGLTSRLPRPGNWMITLKKILGLALALTAIWLLSVLAVQLSLNAALIVGALMAAIGLALYMLRYMNEGGRKAVVLGVVVMVLASFWTPYSYSSSVDRERVSVDKAFWTKFYPNAIPRLVAEGKTVFVNITAVWCITCQVNKAAVLLRGDVFDLLKGNKVIAMEGDWTRPDPEITAYLKSFNRFGIPFNAIYGPGAPNGIALPELLTSGLVLDGLAKASDGRAIVSR